MERNTRQDYHVQRRKGLGNTKEQFTITVAGKDLDGALTEYGIYISIPSVCRGLEIEHKPQIRRIKRHPEAQSKICQLTLPTAGGTQTTTCLAASALSIWLEGIQADTVPEQCRERLLFYQHNLTAIVETIIPAPTSVSGTEETPEAVQLSVPLSNLTVIEERYTVSASEGETLEMRRDLLAHIPRLQDTTPVHTHLYEEDTAIRESYLAGLPFWQTDQEPEKQPFYTASNQLEVYVSNPSQPIELSVALQRIQQLTMRTVITSRIVFWLWSLRRNDPRCSADGWIAFHVEEILELRGVTMHSRAVSPGSSARISDGYYEEKFKEQTYQDLRLLNDSHIRRYVTIVGEDQIERTYFNEWPYLRVNFMMEKLPGGDQIVGIAAKPGEWMPRELREAFHRFAEIDKRIFQLNPKIDQHAIFLALYLAEHWRHQAQQAHAEKEVNDDPWFAYREPIRMRDLLAASVIPIDWTHLTTRFARRIEEALSKLYEKSILALPPLCLTAIDQNRNWGKDWLDSYWALLPSLDEPVEEVHQLTLTGEVIEMPRLRRPKRRKKEQ